AVFIDEARQWQVDGPRCGVVSKQTALDSGPRSGVPVEEQSRARVLLADDNADMREYVCRLLKDRFDVEAVANGEEALRAAQEHVPSLVLTDVMMPLLDGFGLLRALRQNPRTGMVPVILLS